MRLPEPSGRLPVVKYCRPSTVNLGKVKVPQPCSKAASRYCPLLGANGSLRLSNRMLGRRVARDVCPEAARKSAGAGESNPVKLTSSTRKATSA